MDSQIQNLLFDLGNVIIDLDIDKTAKELQQLFRADADKSLFDSIALDYECGKVSTEIFINTILSQCHRKAQAFDVIEAWNAMLLGIPDQRLEMLKVLRKKYKVYLLSNTNDLHLEWIYRYLKRVHGIEHFENDFFDHAYYSHLIRDRKPNPSIFKYIIEDSFMMPSSTLYMDDVQENLDTAITLGFKTHLVLEGEEIAGYLSAEGFI